MTTVIAVYNSEGCVGRCDARCHEAKDVNCLCICGGRNHGKGTDQAIENTREYAETMLAEYANSEAGHEWSEVVIPARYTAQSVTACKIARLINAHYAANVVQDVVRTEQKRWQVNLKDEALLFSSLTDCKNFIEKQKQLAAVGQAHTTPFDFDDRE